MSQDTPGKTGSDAFSAALAAELEVESQIDKIDWETGQLATQRREATAEGDHARVAKLKEQIYRAGRASPGPVSWGGNRVKPSEFRRGADHAVPDSVRVARPIRADTAAAAVPVWCGYRPSPPEARTPPVRGKRSSCLRRAGGAQTASQAPLGAIPTVTGQKGMP